MNYKCNFLFLNFYWSKSGLPFCVSFRCTAKQISYTYTCTSSFFLNSFPYRSLQSIEQSSLCYIHQVFLSYLFYIQQCVCPAQSPNVSLLSSPLVTISLFSTSMTLKRVLVYTFFFFWQHHTACKILVLPPRIEPLSPGVKARSFSHWTTIVPELQL